MKNFILKKFSLKNFTLKKLKRYVPASATVEAAFVIPLVIYAVAAVMFLLQVMAIKMHVSDALYRPIRPGRNTRLIQRRRISSSFYTIRIFGAKCKRSQTLSLTPSVA